MTQLRPPTDRDKPKAQQTELDVYIYGRMRDGNLDLYSAFLLAHEALRIGRQAYLQSAWGWKVTIRRLLDVYMHGLTARAFGVQGIVSIADGWFIDDSSGLEEHRPHFFTSRLADGLSLFTNLEFLQSLSEMRDKYDSLDDDDGPYHIEVFPAHYAAPERELLQPGSQPQFRIPEKTDPEIEDLIVELCTGRWA